jgi:hypothetical protein
MRKALHQEDLNALLISVKPIHDKYASFCVYLKPEVVTVVSSSVEDKSFRRQDGYADEFIELSSDIFAKKSNPYFLMNKVSVDTYIAGKNVQASV